MGLGAAFPMNLPVLNEKNWERWRVQMKAILGYQEVAEIVKDHFSALGKTSTDQVSLLT